MTVKLKPAAFLDRDGTINVDKEYLYKVEDFEYIDGAIEALGILQEKGYMLVIITNQSGIARGYYRDEDFAAIDNWMREDLQSKGIEIAGVYYCPHHPEAVISKYKKECNCRKPKTGLFWKAQRELGIDMDRSIAIGDKKRDLCICGESGVKGFLVNNQPILEVARLADDVRDGRMEYGTPLNKKIIADIQNYIEECDAIFVFDDRNRRIRELKEALMRAETPAGESKKILFLGMEGENGLFGTNYKVITQDEYQRIFQLYTMYEFTDKLRVISVVSQYGSMLNYLTMGVMTQEEYVEALLK